ncbi:hypothetical protein [Nocardia brasiliensis]|uniref:hypothetical protein n=1 Tax=Nocardia brasiliensis TaxID=37326 RepID=UPI003D8CD7A4
MSNGGDSFDLHIENPGTAQVGNNNKLEVINKILARPYSGKNARTRRAIVHDLESLPLYPEGKAKSDRIAAIEKRTIALAKQDQRSPGERWLRRGVIIAVVCVIIAVAVFFIVPINERRALIAHGHPDSTLKFQLVRAAGSISLGQRLSPRGNVMQGPEAAVVHFSQPDEHGDYADHVYFSFNLVALNQVTICDPDAQDRAPRPKNGQFIALEFEVTIGDYKINSASNPLSREGFGAFDLHGNGYDTGQTSGSECVLDAVSNGLENIQRNETRRIKVVVDVLPGHGFISYAPDPAWWPWEWRY